MCKDTNFSSYFPKMESMQRSFPTFSFTLFPVMEKGAKDQADGKCSHTGSYAPTVGPAPARSIMANTKLDGL
jgi:hypothetical protein